MSKAAYAKQLGARLKERRRARDLEPEEMADLLGIPTNTYGKYEAGARTLPHELLVRLVKVTGENPWYLLSGEGEPPNVPPENPIVAEFRRQLEKAPPNLHRKMLSAAKLTRTIEASDPKRAAAFRPKSPSKAK